MTELIMLLTVLIGLPTLIGLIIRSDNKRERKAIDDAKLRADKWLDEQKLIPLSVVEVKTKTGIEFRSEPQAATAEVWGGYFGPFIDKITSKNYAERLIESSVKADRFRHEDTFYPMCEIEKMTVVEA